MTRLGSFDNAELGREVNRRLAEGAIVVVGPKGMTDSELLGALLDTVLALKKVPDRPRVYLMLDAAVNQEVA
jgi:hypothetical protein